jgi:hypothetical protein
MHKKREDIMTLFDFLFEDDCKEKRHVVFSKQCQDKKKKVERKHKSDCTKKQQDKKKKHIHKKKKRETCREASCDKKEHPKCFPGPRGPPGLQVCLVLYQLLTCTCRDQKGHKYVSFITTRKQ